MAVLNTTSPTVSPGAPTEWPMKVLPSASASSAGGNAGSRRPLDRADDGVGGRECRQGGTPSSGLCRARLRPMVRSRREQANLRILSRGIPQGGCRNGGAVARRGGAADFGAVRMLLSDRRATTSVVRPSRRLRNSGAALRPVKGHGADRAADPAGQRPSAAMPARATCTSCSDFTPLTPMAPTQCPSAITGTPPSSRPFIAGALRNAVRPLLIMSS